MNFNEYEQKAKKYNLWLWGNSQLSSREHREAICAQFEKRKSEVEKERKVEASKRKELRKIGLIFAIHSLIVVSYGQLFLQNLEFTRSWIAIRCSLQKSERNRSHTAHTRSITFILDFIMYILKYFLCCADM